MVRKNWKNKRVFRTVGSEINFPPNSEKNVRLIDFLFYYTELRGIYFIASIFLSFAFCTQCNLLWRFYSTAMEKNKLGESRLGRL